MGFRLGWRGLLFFAFAVPFVCASCGGGSTSSTGYHLGGSGGAVVPPVGGSGNANPASGQTAPATFVIKVPKPTGTTSAGKRSPQYIPSTTLSLKLTDPGDATFTPLIVNIPTGCTSSSGFYTCTITASLAVGTNVVTLAAYDAANAGGNLLSQQVATLDALEGHANSFSFTLDAQVGSAGCASPAIAVSPPGSGATGSDCSGTSEGTFTLNGTSALVFTVVLEDADGNSIAPSDPGAPVLSATQTGGLLSSVTASTNPAAYTVTMTPSGTSGSGTVTVSAKGATSGDGITARSITFNIATEPTLIALGEASASQGQVGIYTLGTSSFTQYGLIPPAALGSYTPAQVGFDTGNTLFMFDNNNNVILEFPYSELNETSGETFTTISSGITGNPSSGLYATFSLGPDGTMAVGNSASSSTLNQLVAYASGATTPSLTRAFGGPTTGYYYRAGASAVLTNSSGGAFGYAVGLESDNGTADENTTASLSGSGKIGLISTTAGAISGSSSSTCSVTCYELDITNEGGQAIGDLNLLPGLIWNNHNQELVFFDNTNGIVSYYTFNTATSTFAAPVKLASYTSGDDSEVDATYAVSQDGHLAYSYADINGNTYIAVYNSSHTLVSPWNPGEFAYNGSTGFVVTGMAFLPNDDLLIAGGFNSTPNQLFAYTLSSTTAIATQTATLSSSGTTGVTSSGQSVGRRRPRQNGRTRR